MSGPPRFKKPPLYTPFVLPELNEKIFSHLDAASLGALASTSQNTLYATNEYRARRGARTGRTEFIEALTSEEGITEEQFKTFLQYRCDANTGLYRGALHHNSPPGDHTVYNAIAAFIMRNSVGTFLKLLAEAIPTYFTQTHTFLSKTVEANETNWRGSLSRSDNLPGSFAVIHFDLIAGDTNYLMRIWFTSHPYPGQIAFSAQVPYSDPDAFEALNPLLDGAEIKAKTMSEPTKPNAYYAKMCHELANSELCEFQQLNHAPPMQNTVELVGKWGGPRIPAGDGFNSEVAARVATFLTNLICYSDEYPCVLRAAFTDMAV